MTTLVILALFGWIPVVLLIFSAFPPRRAVIVAFITGWLFLPYAGFDIPSLPDYTKLSATSLGVLLATTLFCSDWLIALRPRWFDVPMATWCLCPIASSLGNGLGLYDGLSVSFDYFVSWGLPYLIGRIYFTRPEHLRELAMGILAGGLVYVPFCVWELRMSPMLHAQVYGINAGGWGEVVYGGYRPKVFMSCALELGLWMTAASTIGFWLWASGAAKYLWSMSCGSLLVPLLIVTVLCKVTGAWILLFAGISLWYLMRWSGSRFPAIVLLLVPILYMTTRTAGIWTGREAVALVRAALNDRRADSLAFRMYNEDMLINKALQTPVYGWGGWNRASVENEEGTKVSIFDGMWIIILGNNGLLGLISFYSALLLPLALLIKGYPARLWQAPAMAPAAVLSVLAALYSIDCLANAMMNPIYVLVAGGLTGAIGSSNSMSVLNKNIKYNNRFQSSSSGGYGPGPRDCSESIDPREEAAVHLGSLGRSLAGRGMMDEAEDALLSSLRCWADLTKDHPYNILYKENWINGLNDTAWYLVTPPRSGTRGIPRAIQLAEQAVGLDPENPTYWNTLGIAYFRMGDWNSAIHALERSTELSAGGTSFDYFFLAVAYLKRGDAEQARDCYSRAIIWMKEHKPDHEDLLRFRSEAESLLRGSLPETLHSN